MLTIANSSIIADGVVLGDGSVVQDFCIVGVDSGAGSSTTVSIGSGALLRAHTVIYAGNIIGARFRTGNKCNVREDNEIGDDVSFGTMCVIEHHVRIGSRCKLHSNVFIPEYSVLEDDVWIGPDVTLTNSRYPATPSSKSELSGPTIRRAARIGAHVTILPGVSIGEGSLVGAGAVVTKDIPPGMVAYGNPARIRGSVGALGSGLRDVTD